MGKIKTRNDLAKHFAKLGFNRGAEIGVLGGTYSITLCQANPGLKLYSVDLWGLDGGKYKDYHFRKYKEAKQRLATYNAKLVRKSSMEAVRDFKDNSLDFVYIDANHSFDNVMRDIIEWATKVKRGGIVSGHDYENGPRVGVKDAVDVYVKHHKRELNVTAESELKQNLKDDCPDNAISWWFVK